VALLADNEGARLLAGGQSLMPALNMRLDAPSLLVDINGIAGLDTIAHKNGAVEIGALVRHAAAERSSEISQSAPLIAQALPHIGHPAIRNRGTIGGSIALADPAAELPACLLALGGEVHISGPSGRRTVKADDFFHGLFETALEAGEVLTAIRVAAADTSTRTGFAEFCRRHGDYAMVGLAACARRAGERLRDVRLAYFGVGAKPTRASGAEAALSGSAGDAGAIDNAVAALASDLDPPDDIQCSGTTKKHLAAILLRRVVSQLAE
jgi:carbon-monoxide dehydrogenase medium subunit